MNKDSNSISKTKINLGLQLVKALYKDDMDGAINILSTYMFFTGLTVKDKTIARFTEDGLISPQKSDEKRPKPLSGN